jgi:succinate-semialdehyde dehydrogenase/glutarate-semialdehyde dehydrogenase
MPRQWAKGSIDKRLPVLHKLADLIDSRTEELAKIASVEMGKLIEQSRGEVKLCAQIARYYADNAKQFLAHTGSTNANSCRRSNFINRPRW